ncbi:TPM domain-containing protein [Thermomonas carbonis]|uniref:TPM domain-containing protein n=1 Tax=Thermomonas carbonis TaxID=1463158 RepID=A0A7G9SSQ9_9GAMM|nr:TPM domain-containing protein [Thermomonas carbonis]QNN70884.1 TPM domain-containing protein [Thermomonas carbonis]
MRVSSLALAVLAAVGCGKAPAVEAAGSPPQAARTTADANLVAAQIADTLQACSYDGRPVQFGMGGAAPRDCRDMIEQVMAFTGLPQNFDVTEADVPNAAAAILLDQQKLPHRVIAFNPQFIELVRRETGGNPWSAVSIMAHEAGHHLAGHTIQPGGSQPPIELEADKFSGFVLYKMGASRSDTLKAINTLVPEAVPGDSTHPGRSQRAAAVGDGWDSACRQTGRGDCASGAPGSAPAPGIVGSVVQSPVAQESAIDIGDAPAAPTATPSQAPVAASASSTAVVLPTPDPKALPSKGMQFVYDEYGILDPKIVADAERQMYDHAKQHGVEIVTMLVKDLHGMTAEQYGWAMMRQLRVGKLDVGNGAVLVLAPDQGQAAAVMGPGVALEMGSHDKSAQLKRWIESAWPQCKRKNACGNWTENMLLAADHIRRDTDDWEWTLRYQSLGDIQAQVAAENGTVRPQDSGTWHKIVRFGGTVVDLAPQAGNKVAWVNAAQVADGRKAVHVRSDEGLTAMVYLDPRTEALMPGGALQAGKRYVFIAREAGLSWNPKDTQSLDLLSYVQAK